MKQRIISMCMLFALMFQITYGLIVPVNASTTLTITQPSNYEWIKYSDAPRLEWNKVTGAAGYRISIRSLATNELLVENKWTTSTYYNLDGKLDAAASSYKIWVGAMYSKSDAGSAAFTSSTITVYTEPESPEIEDETWEETTYNSVVLSMEITRDNGSAITDSGFYIVESGLPTNDRVKYSFKKYGSYSATSKGYKEMTITGLKPDTKYYFWAYAVNGVDETISSRHAVTTDEYDCPHTSGVYTNTYPESVSYIDIDDSEQHKEIWYYHQYCNYCDEVVKEKAVKETYYKDHQFVADVCKLCKYALACPHESVSKEYYKTTYTIVDENKHIRNAFYEPVCDDCGDVTDTRTLFDKYEEKHTFKNRVCTECGYVKAEELSVTVTVPSSNAFVGSTITVSAQAIGGAGSYDYAYSIYKDGVQLDSTDYSSMKGWSYIASETGTYYFTVHCKDGDGTVVTKNSENIIVTSDPNASKTMIITAPSNGKYIEEGEDLDIVWQKVDGAYGYYVWIKNVSRNEVVVDNAWTFDTAYNIDGILNIAGSSYTIRISAYTNSYNGTLISEDAITIYTLSNSMSICGETVSVTPGDTIDVKIDVVNNPGWKSLKFNLEYDNDYFTVSSVQYNSAILTASDVLWHRIGDDKITINCFDTSSYNSVWTDEGTYITITFDVALNVQDGEYPISITYDNDDVFDENASNIVLDIINARIEIDKEGDIDSSIHGDVNGDGRITQMDVTRLRKYLAGGWNVTIDTVAADVTGDGRITQMDVTRLRKYLAGGWNVELE